MSVKFQQELVDWELVDDVMFLANIDNYTEMQLNAVLGSLLGDGFLSKPSVTGKSSIRWNHSYKQKEYTFHKYQMLSEHATSEPVKRENPGYGDFWSVLHLKSSAVLGSLYAALHPSHSTQKTITPTFLAMITHPIALAWWFMDDGSRTTNLNRGSIATNGFTQEEVELLSGWLLKKWDLKTTVSMVHHSSTGTQAPVLYVPSKTFLDLNSLAAAYFPECMKYKIEIATLECAMCGAEIPKSHNHFCSVDCAKTYREMKRKEYYEQNKERFRAKSREWKANHHEAVLESGRRYRQNLSEEQREVLRKRSAAYLEKNREAINARKREWRAAHRNDPIYKKQKAIWDKNYLARVHADPEKLAEYKAKRAAYRKEYSSRPEVQEHEREMQRAYRAAINADPEKKAKQLERDRKANAARIAKMTPEELAAAKALDSQRNKSYREKLQSDPEKLAAHKEKVSKAAAERYKNRTPEERERINARRRELRAQKAALEGKTVKSRGRYTTKKDLEITQKDLF
jgi:hypothetical protein